MENHIELLNTPLSSFGLTARTQSALKLAGIITLGQLILKHKNELPKINGFGKKSLVEVEELVAEKGLMFNRYYPSDKNYASENPTVNFISTFLAYKKHTEEYLAQLHQFIYDTNGNVLTGREKIEATKFESIYGQQEHRIILPVTELKPCPLCGQLAMLSGMFPSGQYYIQCSQCRCSIWEDREDKAVALWNMRSM